MLNVKAIFFSIFYEKKNTKRNRNRNFRNLETKLLETKIYKSKEYMLHCDTCRNATCTCTLSLRYMFLTA